MGRFLEFWEEKLMHTQAREITVMSYRAPSGRVAFNGYENSRTRGCGWEYLIYAN